MGYTIDIEIDGYTYFCILTPIIDPAPPPPPRNTPEFPLKTLSSTSHMHRWRKGTSLLPNNYSAA